MNKLINDPAKVITDALRGLAAAYPELRVDHDNRIVYRGDAPVPLDQAARFDRLDHRRSLAAFSAATGGTDPATV